MLKIYFGETKGEIYNPPLYFANQYEDEWTHQNCHPSTFCFCLFVSGTALQQQDYSFSLSSVLIKPIKRIDHSVIFLMHQQFTELFREMEEHSLHQFHEFLPRQKLPVRMDVRSGSL